MFEIDMKPIPATNTVKLLGITIDCRLKFSEHVNTLCKKANNKTSAFSHNKMFECSEFPDKLKLADVSPIFKADDPTLKFNFRPISVLQATASPIQSPRANHGEANEAFC